MGAHGVPKTKAEQVADFLRSEVAKKQEGDRLPSQRELVERFGFASQTVQNGMAMVRAEGLIVSAGNMGNFVSRSEPVGDLRDEIHEIRSQVARLIERLDELERRCDN